MNCCVLKWASCGRVDVMETTKAVDESFTLKEKFIQGKAAGDQESDLGSPQMRISSWRELQLRNNGELPSDAFRQVQPVLRRSWISLQGFPGTEKARSEQQLRGDSWCWWDLTD